jgi:hypothetical protein
MVDISKDKFEQAVSDSVTIEGIRNILGISRSRIITLSKKYDTSLDNLIKYGPSANKILETMERICPQCHNIFKVRTSDERRKTVCSRSCANTYFRSGSDHANWKSYDEVSRKSGHYRRICFYNHEHKCVFCDEDKAVVVHHYDEDCTNNDPANLIPLCPTHHSYIHTDRLKHLIIPTIEKYIENYNS